MRSLNNQSTTTEGNLSSMAKPRITLVTSAEMPNLYADESGLLDALSDRGADPTIVVWNDPAVNWDEAGVCVVRSVSDSARDRAAFLAWAESVPRILNHPDVLRWNSDKHYMIDLAERGLPVIPTTWLEPDKNLSKQQVHSRFPAMGDFVVKPAVSSGVRDVGRYTANDTYQRKAAIEQAAELLAEGRSVMVQRYLEEIDLHGEISLVFFNGLVSHSVEKRAVLNPATVTEDQVQQAVVTAQQATEEQWRWGEQIRTILHNYVRERMGRDEQFLFNRVDLVPDGHGSFLVMELSMVDADLYLTATPEALGNFADAITVRAFW